MDAWTLSLWPSSLPRSGSLFCSIHSRNQYLFSTYLVVFTDSRQLASSVSLRSVFDRFRMQRRLDSGLGHAIPLSVLRKSSSCNLRWVCCVSTTFIDFKLTVYISKKTASWLAFPSQVNWCRKVGQKQWSHGQGHYWCGHHAFWPWQDGLVWAILGNGKWRSKVKIVCRLRPLYYDVRFD
jgi:hypothetical protein